MEAQPKILIVEDDSVIRESLDALLSNKYDLYFAENGVEGLARALEVRPDLLLLDVMMPALNGFEVCEQIRANPILAEMPVIMLTALDDRESRLRGLRVGADDFIGKPFDTLELLARIQTITRLNRYRRLLEQRNQLEVMHKELLISYEKTIEGWSKALDLRDKETEGHTMRVTQVCINFARAAGVPEEEMDHVRMGSLLHDIGKLGVPDAILLKPGKLTDEEWEVMRRHPLYAHEWLQPIPFLQKALVIPYYHHERWDGSGYPQGLRGEEIPLFARLFAIVDVWDALRSDRPYRAALPEAEVLEYLQRNAGSHFDPLLVNVFIVMRTSAEIG